MWLATHESMAGEMDVDELVTAGDPISRQCVCPSVTLPLRCP